VGYVICHSPPSNVEVLDVWNRRSIGAVGFHSKGKDIFTLKFILSVSVYLEKY
jgi:hypothetical protein